VKPRFAREIVVDHIRGKVFIDGHEFPYLIAEDGVEVTGVGIEDFPAVSLAILTDRVKVIRTDQPVEEYATPWADEDAVV